MHSYHFLKQTMGISFKSKRKNASWLSWCPLDIHHQVVTTRRYHPLGHLPLSGFPASRRQRAQTALASVLPGLKGKQSQFQHTGCLGPRPEGGLSSAPLPTQPLLCQQHRGAVTLPLSPGTLGNFPWDYWVSKSYRICKNSLSYQITSVYSFLRPVSTHMKTTL